MNIEEIMLSEISQPQKDRNYMTSTYMKSVVKFIEAQSEMVLPGPDGSGRWAVAVQCISIMREKKKVSFMHVENARENYCTILYPILQTFKRLDFMLCISFYHNLKNAVITVG